MAQHGSYAEMMLVHENACVKVREDVPMDRLALIGCGATTGLGAVLNTAAVGRQHRLRGGLRRRGPQLHPGSGPGRRPAHHRRGHGGDQAHLAREFGATDVIDASGGDVVERIRDLTDDGVDYSFEAMG